MCLLHKNCKKLKTNIYIFFIWNFLIELYYDKQEDLRESVRLKRAVAVRGTLGAKMAYLEGYLQGGTDSHFQGYKLPLFSRQHTTKCLLELTQELSMKTAHETISNAVSSKD